MFKKLREKSKNKKGFTMVELIVVIVIILVLAGAMVPSLMKYVENAKKANCKADAATLLAQVQADFAGAQASEDTGVTAVEQKYGEITVSKNGTLNKTSKKKNAIYKVENEEITEFSYFDGEKYTATWEAATGWSVKEDTTP